MPSEKMSNLDKKPLPIATWNEEDYDKSRNKILKLADYIIPGHSPMFKNNFKN